MAKPPRRPKTAPRKVAEPTARYRPQPITRGASQARHEFFPLLERVTAPGAEDIVLISHRGLRDRAALVNATWLRRTMALLDDLLARRSVTRGTDFRLIGSAALVGDPATVLDEVRHRQRDLAARKRDDS